MAVNLRTKVDFGHHATIVAIIVHPNPLGAFTRLSLPATHKLTNVVLTSTGWKRLMVTYPICKPYSKVYITQQVTISLVIISKLIKLKRQNLINFGNFSDNVGGLKQV